MSLARRMQSALVLVTFTPSSLLLGFRSGDSQRPAPPRSASTVNVDAFQEARQKAQSRFTVLDRGVEQKTIEGAHQVRRGALHVAKLGGEAHALRYTVKSKVTKGAADAFVEITDDTAGVTSTWQYSDEAARQTITVQGGSGSACDGGGSGGGVSVCSGGANGGSAVGSGGGSGAGAVQSYIQGNPDGTVTIDDQVFYDTNSAAQYIATGPVIPQMTPEMMSAALDLYDSAVVENADASKGAVVVFFALYPLVVFAIGISVAITLTPGPTKPQPGTHPFLPPPPTINVTALPPPMKGYLATVTNLAGAKFLVPDGTSLGVSCTNTSNYVSYVCGGGASAYVPPASGPGSCASMGQYAGKCIAAPPTCDTLGLKDSTGRSLNTPLFSLPIWAQMNPNVRLLVNANWFDVNGPRGFPYVMPCTAINGYSVSNGKVLSSATTPDGGNLLDALVIQTPPGASTQVPSIVRSSAIDSLTNVWQAVGGFIILDNGTAVTPPSNSGNTEIPDSRTAVGLSKDGTTMYVVVVAAGFAAGTMDGAVYTSDRPKVICPSPGNPTTSLICYMKQIGAYNAINLDNSGSSQFIHQNNGTVIDGSRPGDVDETTDDNAYRPIPNFFGVYSPGGGRWAPARPGARAPPPAADAPSPSWSPRCDTPSSQRRPSRT